MVNSGFWRLILGNVGSGPFVESGNRVGYLNYVPNETELADYKDSYSGRMAPIIQWFRGYPESLDTVDPLLDKIKTPTLIFWGEDDHLLSVDNGRRLNKRMDNSELHILKNCGHFSYQDQYHEFKNMLIDWVKKHS